MITSLAASFAIRPLCQPDVAPDQLSAIHMPTFLFNKNKYL